MGESEGEGGEEEREERVGGKEKAHCCVTLRGRVRGLRDGNGVCGVGLRGWVSAVGFAVARDAECDGEVVLDEERCRIFLRDCGSEN